MGKTNNVERRKKQLEADSKKKQREKAKRQAEVLQKSMDRKPAGKTNGKTAAPQAASQKPNGYEEMKKKTTVEVGKGQLNSAFKACQDLIGKGQIIPADLRGQLTPMERRALSVQAQTSGQYKINGITKEALAKRPAPKTSTNAQQYTK